MKLPTALTQTPQWILWRMETLDSGKPAKVPYQVNGWKASTVDPNHWSTFQTALNEALRTGGTWSGLGFVFAESDPFIGIDLDKCFTDGELDSWAADVLAQFPTYTELSPSGEGLKLWLKGTLPSTRGRRLDIKSKPGAHLEVYSAGRYFTVTGDQWGPHEEVEDCQPGLDWLASSVLEPMDQVKIPQKVYTPTPVGLYDAQRRAELYAQSYPPAISGQDGHGTTYRLACVLVNGFGLGVDGARPILNSWNASCQPPWSARELEHKLTQAERTGARENLGPYMLAQTTDFMFQDLTQSEMDKVEVYLGDLLAKAQKVRLDTKGFPAHLLQVPGLMSKVMRYISTQNPRQNPLLSLVGALALQCGICGSKVRDKTGNRTNLYLVGLAPAGGGKQAPLNCIEKILVQCQWTDLYGGKVSSDSAMASDLTVSRSKVYLWDEFGRFLDKTRASTGGAHLNAVQDALLELWGKAGGVWKQKAYSDSKNNKEVIQPCCSFLGFTVPGRFWGGLEEGHLADGFAARLMVIDTGERAGLQEVIELDPPRDILEEVSYWKDIRPGGALSQAFPQPIVVPETPAATELFRQLAGKSETAGASENEEAIWSRVNEKARRLALCYACSRDKDAPCIDDTAARWGVELATWTTEAFIRAARDEVVSDDAHHRRWQKVRKILAEQGKKNQLTTRSMLLRGTKWPSKELDSVLQTMDQAGILEVRHQPGSNGKMSTYYKLKG